MNHKRAEEGDIAIVTTVKGRQYVGVYTLAPGIDYFWNAVVKGTAPNPLIDPEYTYEVIGRIV